MTVLWLYFLYSHGPYFPSPVPQLQTKPMQAFSALVHATGVLCCSRLYCLLSALHLNDQIYFIFCVILLDSTSVCS